jgi:hypothetical protein
MNDVVQHPWEISPFCGNVRKILRVMDDIDTQLPDREWLVGAVAGPSSELNGPRRYSIHSMGNHDITFTVARRRTPVSGSAV